jgi:hypothetical protein
VSGEGQSSREACPVCGAHELHLLYFPAVDITGARQYDEIFGLGDVKPEQAPGIGCAACGWEWPDLESFRREAKRSEGR